MATVQRYLLQKPPEADSSLSNVFLFIMYRQTKEGEVIPLCQYPLDVQTETCNASDNFVFLVWPVTVVHKIDSSSPLWNVSAEQLLTERFEIVVILEGTRIRL
jgi:potassium inwardly-rectifying channel subfamily J